MKIKLHSDINLMNGLHWKELSDMKWEPPTKSRLCDHQQMVYCPLLAVFFFSVTSSLFPPANIFLPLVSISSLPPAWKTLQPSCLSLTLQSSKPWWHSYLGHYTFTWNCYLFLFCFFPVVSSNLYNLPQCIAQWIFS